MSETLDDDPVVIAAMAAMNTLCSKPVSYEVAAKVVAAIQPIIEVHAKADLPVDTVDL